MYLKTLYKLFCKEFFVLLIDAQTCLAFSKSNDTPHLFGGVSRRTFSKCQATGFFYFIKS